MDGYCTGAGCRQIREWVFLLSKERVPGEWDRQRKTSNNGRYRARVLELGRRTLSIGTYGDEIINR